MKKQSYHICEYGVIRSLNDYGDESISSLSELYLPKKQFESFYDYISQNQEDSTDSEKPFSLFSKGKRRQIKVKNYVGIIETKDGLHLEILPKIHFNRTANELLDTKSVFLKMLKHLKNSPFVNISKAHLEAKKDFPILEVFIKSYINEAEKIYSRGVKSDYVLQEDNVPYLRGKLKVNQNIKYNFANKAKFFCEFSEYSPNIPANRLIKSTLIKLLKLTNSYNNSYSINKLLSHVEDVDVSSNIKGDLTAIKAANRLLIKYKSILLWSEVFLLNKSFTNFKGDSLNMAILFPMERIFEDYIAFLFNKYSDGYNIKLQDQSYFLVENHKDTKKFRLKPDLVVDKNLTRKKIIDTKWKLLNEFAERKNYNISQADMYQLYAYGRKYSTTEEDPCLVLIYPTNPNFSNKLDKFIYEGDLTLEVIPFDLSSDELHQKEQIDAILNGQ